MMKKSIVFAYNGAYELTPEFIANLQFLGFNVIPISVSRHFVYKSKLQHISSYLFKKLLNSREIEKKQKIEPYIADFEAGLKSVGGWVDYVLMIRPDDFPISFIKKLKKISGKMVAYQWDGFHLFPEAAKRVQYFDRFFVFDPNDLDENKNLLPTTNFYFDYHSQNPNKSDSESIYFFGTFINYRMEAIANLTKYLKKINKNPDISIVACKHDNVKKFEDSGIKFFETGISFAENIRRAKKAGVLVDFINGKHSGLSFRTFDAIGNDKKLITTNAEVVKYDFYRPENIFVLRDENLHELEEFLSKPYMPLPIKIKNKYGFTNWLHYLLDIPPYDAIKFPGS